MKNTTVFKTLQLMHKMMLGGQVLFVAVMFLLVWRQVLEPAAKEKEKIIQAVVLIVTVATIVAGNRLLKRKISAINNQPSSDAKSKLEVYRPALLQYWSLSEVGTMVSGIGFMLTGNYAFLTVAGVVILYFGMLAPVKDRIADQLNIPLGDLDQL